MKKTITKQRSTSNKVKLKIEHIYVIWATLIVAVAFLFLIYPKVSTPELEYSISENTIWNQKVVVKISKDSVSKYPIDYYEYCINSEMKKDKCEWKTNYTKNIEVYNNGINYVYVRGVDEKGHKSKSVMVKLAIDNNAPIINSVKVTNKTSNSITIKSSAEDVLSNISYLYSLDGLNYVSGLDEYSFNDLKPYTKYKLYVKVIDEANNQQIAIIEESTLKG